MDLLDLMVRIGVDDQASGAIEGISSKAIAKGNVIAKVFTSVMGTISSSIGSAVSRVDTMGSFSVVMENLGVSGTAAQEAINTLSDKLTGLPTALDTAVSGVKRFTSVNNDVRKSTEYFLAMNNAIIAGGADMASQASAVEQLSQAYAKGKADMQEWRSMQTAMPAQLAQVASEYGMTVAELRQAMSDGEVTMDEFMDALVKLNKEGGENFASFEEQARGATGGIATQMANLNTAVTRNVASVIEAFNKSEAVNKVITGLTAAVNAVGKSVVPVARELGTQVAAIVDKLGSSLQPLANAIQRDGVALAKVVGAVGAAFADLTKALSPVMPVLAKMAPLMALANSAAGKLSASVAGMAQSFIPALTVAVENGTRGAERALSGMTSLSAFAGGPMVAAIMAVVAVLGTLATVYTTVKQRQDEFRNATEGLSDAASALSDAAGGVAGSMGEVGDAASGASADIWDYVEGLRQSTTETANFADSVRDKFSEVSSKGAMLDDLTAKITGLADNWDGSADMLAKQTSYLAKYNELTGESVTIVDEATGKLSKSNDELERSIQAFKENAKAQAYFELYEDTYEQIVKKEQEVASAHEAVGDSVKGLGETYKSYFFSPLKTLFGAKDALGMVKTKEEIANNEKELERLRALLEECEKGMAGYTEAVDDASDAEGEHAESLEGYIESMEKRYDKMYDARKAYYDGVYKSLQKQYRADEKAYAKSLDAKYDALKESLDAELDAVKEADDKRLAELKESQDAEVKAFKEATEKRIELVNDEYEAQKRLVEADKERRVKELDDQIAAIEGLTAAERAERKKAEQDKKIAELQDKSRTAKTYRERKAASEELQDYLADLEQERVEEEREAQIKALEQQKDDIESSARDREDALKDEADARKEQIQASREAELEIVQKANEAEYDELKKSLDDQEKAIGKAHSARLEALREHNSELEEKLSEQHSESLENLKARQSEALEKYKEHLDKRLEYLEKHGQDVQAAVKGEGDTVWQDVEAAVGKVGATLEGGAESAAWYARLAGSGFAEGLREKRGEVETAADELIDAMKQHLDRSEEFKETARNIMEGFRQGMAEGAGAPVQAMSDAVSAMKDAVWDELEIGSPSKLMKRVGKFVMEGWEEGLAANAERPVKAMEDAAGDVYGAAEGSVAVSGGPGFPHALEGAGILITGNTFNVRADDDVERIAERLQTMINRQRRAQAWNKSYSTA